MQSHKAAVKSIAIHPNGNYMSTMGKDGFLKIWDLRTYKEIYDYWTPT
jgi:U3 small nucleolar RNA-associated protein 7